MGQTLRYGKAVYGHEGHGPATSCQPSPIVKLRSVWAEGRCWLPALGDRTTLLLFKRRMPKQVSFSRAYRGWRASGAHEERELGEGRAFQRWLMRHELAIAWQSRDLTLHPYFTHSSAPYHDPHDETAQGMSFALAPVQVGERRVKLYLTDEDVLGLLHLSYGRESDFLALVRSYVQARGQWQTWQAPAPPFLVWVKAHGHKPLFAPGQLGFRPPF